MSDQNLLDFHFHKDNGHHHHNNTGATFLDPYSAALQFNYAISPTFPNAVDSRKFSALLNNNHNTITSAASINSTEAAVEAAAAAVVATTYDRPYYLPPIDAISSEHENTLPFVSLLKQQQQQQQQWKNNDLSQVIGIKPPDIISTNGDHQSTTSSTEDMPTHIVSPEAIREAQKEETEEALGKSQNMPFSAFPSFTSLKEQRRMSLQSSPPTAKKFNIPFSPVTTKNDPYYVNEEDEDDEEEEEEEEEENFPKTPQVAELVVEKENNNRSQEKLKRPPNAYLLFNRDMRRKLLKQSPKMTVAEISKVVGDWWKALPDEQRQYYVKEASLLKEEHLKKYPDFIYTRRSKAELAEAKKLSKLNKRTRDDSVLIDNDLYNNDSDNDEEDSHRKANKKRRNSRKSNSLLNNGQRDPRGRKKKRHKHPYAPKHPMSAYLYYLAEVYPQVSQNFPGSTVGPISKSISRTWHAMSTQERLPWVQKAESDKARYAREMQVYMASNNSPTKNNRTTTDEPTNHKASDDDDNSDDGFEGEEEGSDNELDLHALPKTVNIGTTLV